MSAENLETMADDEKIAMLRTTVQRLTEILEDLDRDSLTSPSVLQSVETLCQNTETLVTEVEKAKLEQISSGEDTESENREENEHKQEETEITVPTVTSADETQESGEDKTPSLLKKSFKWVLTVIIIAVIGAIIFFFTNQQTNTEIAENSLPQEEIPSELTSSEENITLENLPPPEPELTPEQSLITAIQTQVAEITDTYTEGLIISIEPNFLASRLLVTISNDWYQFSPSRQDKLVDDMLERSRSLDFKKLEIRDPQATQIARSPVVGEKMVILKRE